MIVEKYDAVVIGGGGAGLRTAIEIANDPNIKVAVVSKVYPTRSHTGAAQGGMNAALGNVIPDDNPEVHAYDTIKGSDFLADQDAVFFMTEKAPEIIYELDRWGVPFSRLLDGRIAQRPFGGASFPRTVFAADKTGHVLLHTLFEQAIARDNITFFNEYFLLDLIHDGERVKGVTVYDIRNGEVLFLKVAPLPWLSIRDYYSL
ncbi:MAG TPA: FAD-binding protein, partial [Aquificaceae bacterium]|nr:FAD-binding protein [Aquificaceae bacterium]